MTSSPVTVATVRPASLVISPTLASHGILPPLTARHALALRHVEAVILTNALRLGVARPAVTVRVVAVAVAAIPAPCVVSQDGDRHGGVAACRLHAQWR